MLAPFVTGGPFKAGGPFQARGPFLQSGAFELSGQARNVIEQLGGADYTPLADYSNCWTDSAGTIQATADDVVGKIASTVGSWVATQATEGYKPFLRHRFTYAPVVSSTTGETWTFTGTPIAGRAGIRIDSDGEKYFDHESGTTGNYASTPNTVANQITGDACWVFKLYCTDFSYNSPLLDKFGSAGNYGSVVWVGTNGKLQLTASANGTDFNTQQSDNAIAAATKLWVRVKRVSSTGSITFETSPDGETWTQNGAAKTGLTGALFNSTDSLTIGAGYPGTSGKFRLYYAAAYANDTGTGTPAYEFYPQRDCTNFPMHPYLDFDGTDDRLETNIAPGSYDAGYLCGGWTLMRAVGTANAVFGSSAQNSVRGISQRIGTTNASVVQRFDGTGVTAAASSTTTASYVPCVIDAEYSATAAAARLNGGGEGTAGARDYRGSTQVALLGMSNNTESGVTATLSAQGYQFSQIWLPTIPTDEQQAVLRAYCASKAGVTL